MTPSGVFIVNFEQVLHLAGVSILDFEQVNLYRVITRFLRKILIYFDKIAE